MDLEGDFNSFRIGQSLQYQRTYLFPPKPTIIGLAGAALGLADNELQPLYTGISVGTILNHYQGLARDLWGITKFKTVGTEHAVVVREMLYRPSYSIYFAPSKTSLQLKQLQAAFADPHYPLSLGRSDELIVIRSSRITDLTTANPGACYRNTVLPFDYRKRGYVLEKVSEVKHGVLELPQIMTIPEVYSYDKTRERSVAQYRVVTHVFSTGVISKESDGGQQDGERNLFLY